VCHHAGRRLVEDALRHGMANDSAYDWHWLLGCSGDLLISSGLTDWYRIVDIESVKRMTAQKVCGSLLL
jgi:hypothetical protein